MEGVPDVGFGWTESVSQQAGWLYMQGGAMAEEWGWGESQKLQAFKI